MCADICTNEEKNARFQRALDRIVRLEERERHGIGMQKEKTLHAVLKAYEDPDEDHHEIPIENFIADIYCEKTGSITEIQTANFGYLRNKLDAFLPLYHVTVVYPIPAVKWITWIDPETGELGKRSRSPKKGNFYSAFRELYRISSYLDHPNLSIKLILLDMEEYRLKDGWGRDGKRGSHRYDRVPTRLVDETVINEPRDYEKLRSARKQFFHRGADPAKNGRNRTVRQKRAFLPIQSGGRSGTVSIIQNMRKQYVRYKI